MAVNFNIDRALGKKATSKSTPVNAGGGEKQTKTPGINFSVDRALGKNKPSKPTDTPVAPEKKTTLYDVLSKGNMVAESFLETISKPFEAAYKGVVGGANAVTKAMQTPAGLVSGKSIKDSYKDARTLPQMIGDYVRRFPAQYKGSMIENFIKERKGEALTPTTPEEKEQTAQLTESLSEMLMGAFISGKIGTEILKPINGTLKATPQQVKEVLGSGKVVDPRAKIVLEEAAKQGAGIEVQGGKPVGLTREIIGKYVLGGSPTKPKGTVSLSGQKTNVPQVAINNGKLSIKLPAQTDEVLSNAVRANVAAQGAKAEIITGDEVAEYYRDLGTDTSELSDQKAEDLINYMSEEIRKNDYELKVVPVSDILKDKATAEYVQNSNVREFEGSPQSDAPIIIDETGRVRDGLNRLTRAYKDGDDRINAYVAVKKTPEVDDLASSARKYKSAEEFVKDRGLEPDSVLIVDNKNLVVEDTAGRKALLTELPVESFGSPKFETLNQNEFLPGRKITAPIEVTIENGDLRITDGANRFTQAVANKDRTIPVVLVNADGTIPTKSQLTDIWNKANQPEVLESRGGKSIGEFEQLPQEAPPIPKGSAEFKLFERVQEFVQKYAERLGEGYQKRNTLGWYSPKTHNIFINGRNNVSTAAHETMHYVDDKLRLARRIIADTRGVKGSIRDRLIDIYMKYYGAPSEKAPIGTQIREGLAVLLQRYAEMPTTIEAEYGDLVDAILQPGGMYYNQIFDDMVKDLRSLVGDYQKSEALDKIGARVQNNKSSYKRDEWMNPTEKARAFLFDDIFPAELLSKRAGKAMTASDASLWMRMHRSWHGLAASNIKGTRGYWQWDPETGNLIKKLDFNWRTLVQTLTKRGELEDFGYWLVARRKFYEFKSLDELNDSIKSVKEALMEELDIDTRKQLRDNLIQLTSERDHLQEVIDNDGILRNEASEAFNSHAERFRSPAEMYDKLTREDVEMLYKARLITKQEREEYLANVGYASFKREIFNEIVASDTGFADHTVRIGRTKVSSMIRRRGSERAILSPVYNGITNHMEITRKAMQKVVENKLSDEIVDHFPALFQKIAVQTAVDQHGRVTFPQEKDKNIIMARDKDGKRVAIMVNKEVKNVIDNILNQHNFGFFAKLLIGLNRLFTKGTTALYYQFSLPNFIVDQLTSFTNTQNNYIPVYDGLKAVTKAIPKGPVRDSWDKYMILGGERRTMAGWQELSPEQLAVEIDGERSGLLRTIDLVDKYGVGILAKPSQYSEIMTRFGEFHKALENGKSDIVAIEEAGRVSAPFHHIGSLGGEAGQMTIKSIPFANAGFQVTDQFLRTATTKKGAQRQLFLVAALIAAGLGGYATMQRATKKQKEQYRDLDPEMLARYIYTPKPSGDGLNRWRVPENFQWPAAVINMALSNQMEEGIDYDAAEYLSAGTSWVPTQLNPTDVGKWVNSLMPQAAKPLLQVWMGRKDFPTVTDMEPLSTQNLPVELRTQDNTSPVAKYLSKTIGKEANLSPIKIDYLITGYAGRASGLVTGKPNAYNPFASIEQDYYYQSGRTLQEYYRVKTETAQDNTAYNKQLKDLSNPQLSALAEAKARVKQVDKYIKMLGEMDIEQNPGEADKLRDEILSQAKATVEAYKRGQ